MTNRPLTVAWFSFFPVEWLPDIPESLRKLPRLHAATWQRVLLAELEKKPSICLHILVLRKQFERSLSFERNGVTFHLIKTPGGLRAPSLFWLDTFLIKRVLAKIKPDLVHAWGTEQGAALVASRLGYPYVVTVQGLMSLMVKLFNPTLHLRLSALLERISLTRAPLVTAESRFSTQYLRSAFPRLTVRHIEVVPDPLFHRVQRNPQTDPLRIIFVGRLGPHKGGDLLLLALDQIIKEFPFELIVVGRCATEFLKKMKSATSAALWQRIQFKNELTSADIAEELAVATMMMLPTRADTGPMAVKEAVVAGVPVVASAVGGITDYVFPGENGYLFPSENLNACISALKAACRHPLFSRGLVEAATLVKMRDYLSPERMGQSFFETYQLIK
jgi:glycosyltransferase involved in cell wall biosynthesis